MKRQTLQIGSALLATTALSTLSTVAMAGTFEAGNNTLAGTTTVTAASLSAQVFGSTGAANVTLGPISYNIDFENALTSAFDVDVAISGAKFSQLAPVTVLTFQESAGSLTIAESNAACTVQVLTERILVDNCVSLNASTNCRIDVLQLSGVVFSQANGLATVGSSISLSGIVTGNTGNQTFETLSSANVVTSVNSLTTTTSAGGTNGAVTINNTATPPFSKVAGSATSAVVGTVVVTPTGAVGTNLTTVLTTSSLLVGGMNFTVTHDIISDDATTEVHLSGTAVGFATQSVRNSDFNGNVASFNVIDSQSRGSFEIEVNFNGTSAIGNANAGTVAVVYTRGAINQSAPATVSGALASFTRGGFRTQINTAQSSNSANFDSFVRITNNGSVSGTASIQVANDATGSVYGTYTTATIAPNATLQVSMSQIETGTSPAIATVPGQFMLNISGAISGYAQHVMLNTQNGTFVDLSGFRIGNATTGFP